MGDVGRVRKHRSRSLVAASLSITMVLVAVLALAPVASASTSPQIAGVRLAPADSLSNTDPFTAQSVTPVIWDSRQPFHPNATSVPSTVGWTLKDAESVENTTGCRFGGERQWQACNVVNGSVTSEALSWPVVVPQGTSLTLRDVQLWVPSGVNLAGGTLLASVGGQYGAQATIPSTCVGPTMCNIPQVTLSNPTAFATQPGEWYFEINWYPQRGGTQYYAGDSRFLVYVMPRPFVKVPVYNGGANWSYVRPKPYLSLVNLAAISGLGGPVPSRWQAIWGRFANLGVYRTTLDPFTGDVGWEATALSYYRPNWSMNAQVTGTYDRNNAKCAPDPAAALLYEGIAHCGEWAYFLSEVAAVDGITSSPFYLASVAGGPNGEKAMLVGGWTLAGGTSYDKYTWDGTNVSTFRWVSDPDTYSGSRAQGPNLKSPGWFAQNDHELVWYNHQVWDPSYGAGPFPASVPYSGRIQPLGLWARASIKGYAELQSPPQSTDWDVYTKTACPTACVWKFTNGSGSYYDNIQLPSTMP